MNESDEVALAIFRNLYFLWPLNRPLAQYIAKNELPEDETHQVIDNLGEALMQVNPLERVFYKQNTLLTAVGLLMNGNKGFLVNTIEGGKAWKITVDESGINTLHSVVGE